MSQSVARLKELLFDSEAQALSELTKRIEQVADTGTATREEIRNEISGFIERAGTTERFTASVSEVLGEALRRAEVSKHQELSYTIAPLVVTTIKTELRNSQDEMVEALYPITGRLVKAYVASAMKDLTEQMNRRLEQNALMLRLQSLTTGRSVAELALAGTQEFELKELFLIRRGTGELVAHWPPLADSRREQMLSGVLAAVNAFANEAFAADDTSLRQIELNDATVYLRGSPLYLLAAKCSGVAPRGAEQLLDDTLITAVEKQRDADGLPHEEADTWHARLLSDLGDELKAGIAEQRNEFTRPAGNPLKVLAALILLPLLGWLAWGWTSDFADGRTRDTAERVIAGTEAMQGYPARINASGFGRRVRISGLAPSLGVKEEVVRQLTLVLPRTEIEDELAVVPGSDITIPDQTPAITAIRRSVDNLQAELGIVAIRRAASQAQRRLALAETDLKRAALDIGEEPEISALKRHAANVAVISKELSGMVAALPATVVLDSEANGKTTAAMAAITQRIGKQANEIQTMMSGDSRRQAAEEQGSGEFDVSAGPEFMAETMAAEAERLARVAATLSIAAKLKPPPPVVVLAEPSPRDKLHDLASRSAVFFSNGSDYRDAAETLHTLDALVPHLVSAHAFVRIVGYTDLAGTTPGNTTLAAERAEKVRQDLIARGAPASLLTAVGRAEAKDLSMSQGPDSPNRRVEFEIGFDGEGGR